MLQRERYKLLGKYTAPLFKYGSQVIDLERGKVRIVGLSSARIPWPIAVKEGSRGPFLNRALATAVRHESVQSLMYHFGISRWRAQHWRRFLGVDQNNAGTRELRRRWSREPQFKAGLAKAHEQMRNPVRDASRREKIATAKFGKPRPQHAIAAMRAGRTRKRHSPEVRRRMSEAQRARGTIVPGTRPWTDAELHAVRTLPPAEAAAATGRTLCGVYVYRSRMKLPDHRKRERPARKPRKKRGILDRPRWSKAEDRLVLRLSPQAAAAATGRSIGAVYLRRIRLGIRLFSQPYTRSRANGR